MSGLTAYTCTPRETRKFVVRCIKAGRVPFIKSSPAMGKSALVASIANEYGLKLIDHRLSTSAPEDLSGLPQFINGVASFAPFDTFPTEDTLLPGQKVKCNSDGSMALDEDGNVQYTAPTHRGWLLFLDEFNSASKVVQAAAYKLVLDKEVGLKKLHPNVVIVCAGNLATDRAIVNPVGTAMQSRLIHLKMQFAPGKEGVDQFLEDVAFPRKWDSRIIAFLSYKPSMLHDFRPDHNDETFCSPRTWEFMNDLIRGEEVRDEDAALYAGTITSGVAVDFIAFTKVFNSLPKLDVILDDPDNAPQPSDAPTRYATVTYLIDHVNNDNFAKIAIYVNKMGSEFRVLFFRGLMIQKPELRKHPTFRAALVELSRYLHDDIAEAA